jgi:hypothetical protein
MKLVEAINMHCLLHRDLSASGVYMITYCYLLERFTAKGEGQSKPLKIVIAGGLAGTFGTK